MFTATAGSGDARNIWTMAIDPRTGRATGDPRQLTAGPAKLAAPTVSRDGRLVFSDVVENPRILGLPLDANSGSATGTRRSLRADNARLGARASATQMGRSLVFGILGLSGSEVWLKNLETGQERQLAAVPLASLNPLISPTGRFVAYTAIAQERGASGGLGTGYIIEGQNGAPRKVCDGCALSAFADERHIIIGSTDGQKWLLDIQTLERVASAKIHLTCECHGIGGGPPYIRTISSTSRRSRLAVRCTRTTGFRLPNETPTQNGSPAGLRTIPWHTFFWSGTVSGVYTQSASILRPVSSRARSSPCTTTTRRDSAGDPRVLLRRLLRACSLTDKTSWRAMSG